MFYSNWYRNSVMLVSQFYWWEENKVANVVLHFCTYKLSAVLYMSAGHHEQEYEYLSYNGDRHRMYKINIRWRSLRGSKSSAWSDWVLFNTDLAIFQLYHEKNKLILKEMMIRFALYWTITLGRWILIVIVYHWNNSSLIDISPHADHLNDSWLIDISPHSDHWNNSSLIDISPHSDTLSWLWTNQSLLLLFNTACLAEKQQIIIV